jgi:hypothetical protein
VRSTGAVRTRPRPQRIVGLSELALLGGLWIVAASVLAGLTTRALDWFAKDDELRYERLAISIARTHSLVPRIHGVNVQSYSQLYPMLIAPFFRHGLVPGDVRTVHLANAWIMSSASIPAFFLARRVTGRLWAGYLTAALTVAMPWIVLAAMMMTEVASYPAFLWALLALQRATVKPSRRKDVLALLAIGVAYLARGELLVLLIVFPLVVIGYEVRAGERSARRLIRRHDLLAVVYGLLLIVAVVLRATGDVSRFAGVYGRYAKHEQLLPDGLAGSFVEHLATFSLAFGVLPFVVAIAWLLSSLARKPESEDRHAFAWLGSITIAAVMYQSTNFDVLYNAFVHDRFLLYLVPVVVISVLSAVLDASRLRWSLVAPAVLVAIGFVVGAIPFATWGQFPTIDDDAVAGALYKPLAHAFGSLAGARVALVLVTIVGTALLALAGWLVPRNRPALAVAGVLLLALPTTTAYAFARFLGNDDWANRPITNPQVGQFAWVDQTLGRGADVTIAPYPVSSDWFVNYRVWRDYQYWNESIDRNVELPPGTFTWSSFWFPKVGLRFDPTTGRANVDLTRYVLGAQQETRFRISGKQIASNGGLMLIDADRPWRTDWRSSGLYDDGWTRPGTTVRVRVFALPDQRGRVLRTITFGIRAPDGVASRSFELASNESVVRGSASADTVFQGIGVCVPPHRYAEVSLRVTGSSPVPGDLATYATSLRPRRGGAFLSQIALADELGGPCTPKR